MFLWAFWKDTRNYSLKILSSFKNNIWESVSLYETLTTISGILVKLRSPKEVWDTFMRQVSEYALYSVVDFNSTRGDRIVSWSIEYEVIVCQTVQYFTQDDPFNIHYLKLIQ